MNNTSSTTSLNNINTTRTMNIDLTKQSISQLAYLIKRDWKKVNFAALPYLNAMTQVISMEDVFIAEDVRSIVIYFLSNASSYRGENAKAIKTELKRRAKIK